MAIATTSPVCNKHNGVDLQISIVPYINGLLGGQFQFSSDGWNVNSATGFSDPFSGTTFLQIPGLQ